MNNRMKMMHEVAVMADTDRFYQSAANLGRKAAHAFGTRHRSQVTNLESIANSALKVTDVLNYVKKQTARSKERQDWRREDLGVELLGYLSNDLRHARETICSHLDLERDSADGQLIHILLIREFVRQFAAQYEYSSQLGG